MSKVVGEIAIGVTADIGPLVNATRRGETSLARLGRAVDGLSGRLGRFGGATQAIGAKMSIVSGAIVTAAGAAGLLVKNGAELADAIGDAAQQAGMSATAFQEYRFAMKDAADMSGEEFAAATEKLNKTLGEAREGSRSAIKAFEAIGVTQEQLAQSTFTTDDAMAAFVGKVEDMKDPAIAAAVATDLFGKAGAGMGAQLAASDGKVAGLIDRARELGVVIGDDAVAAAGGFGEKMDELSAQFEAVKVKIAMVLLPVVMNTLIPAIQEDLIPAVHSVINALGDWIEWFAQLDPAIQEVVGWITTAFAVGGPVVLAIGVVSTAISSLIAATGPVGLFIAAAGLLYAAWQKWGDDIKGAIGGAIEWVSGKFDAIVAKVAAFVETIKGIPKVVADAFTNLLPGADARVFGEDQAFRIGGGGGGPGAKQADTSAMFDMGINIGHGLADGIGAGISEKMPEIEEYLRSVTTKAEEVFGVQSPSTVFAEIGDYIGQGLASGISASQAMVAQAVQTMGAGATQATGNMVSSILGSLSEMFKGSKAIAAAQAFVNAWAGATEALKLPFPANIAAFGKVLATGLAAVRNIKSASPGGGGGGGGGGGSATSAAAAAPAPSQTLNFTIQNDPFGYGESLVRQISDMVSQASRSGSSLVVNVI